MSDELKTEETKKEELVVIPKPPKGTKIKGGFKGSKYSFNFDKINWKKEEKKDEIKNESKGETNVTTN